MVCSRTCPPASHCPACSLEVRGASSASSGHSGRSVMSTHWGCCAGADRPETSHAHRRPLNGSLWPLSWGPSGRPFSPLTSKLPQSSSPHLSAALLSSAASLPSSCASQCPEVTGVGGAGVGAGAGSPGKQRLTEFPHTRAQKVSEQHRGFWGWRQNVGGDTHQGTRSNPVPCVTTPAGVILD